MPTPPKPVGVLKNEKRSHRTKAELSRREAAENSLITGKQITEWEEVKSNKRAHSFFTKLRQLLKKIDKADALYTPVINRYCLLISEYIEHGEMRDRLTRGLDELKDQKEQEPQSIKPDEYFRLVCEMQKNILAHDATRMTMNKMLLNMERENCMTIMAALRAIPKQEGGGKENEDPMFNLLNFGRRA